MGQRHQAFVIARYGQGRYRCVAAFHHQWCYGRLPLLAAKRMLDLVRQPDNAPIVRYELKAAHEQHGLFSETSKALQDPCPYIRMLLNKAFSVDLDGEDPDHMYLSGGMELPANMFCYGGDNNDGLTFIDVSDPTHPRYCFTAGAETNAPQNILLSGEAYCRAYYPLGEQGEREEEDVCRVIDLLVSEEMIARSALESAFPREFARTEKTDTDVAQELDTPGKATELAQSLADMSLATAINHATDEQEVALVQETLGLPGKLDVARSALKSLPTVPPHVMPLVQRVFAAHGDRIDLSGYKLTSDQIVELVRFLPSPEVVRVVDLSGNESVTSETVVTIFQTFRDLERILLLDTGVSAADMPELISAAPRGLCGIVHPALFRPGSDIPAAFSLLSLTMCGLQGASTPFLSPWRFVHVLNEIVPGMGGLSSDARSEAIEAAFAAAPRDDTTPWGQRTVMFRPALKVKDYGRGAVPTALFGEGWALLLENSYMRDGVGWAFVKFVQRPGAAGREESMGEASFEPVMHDLHALLEAIANLGPPVPLDDIERLEKVLDPQSKMSAREVAAFVKKVQMRSMGW